MNTKERKPFEEGWDECPDCNDPIYYQVYKVGGEHILKVFDATENRDCSFNKHKCKVNGVLV